MSAPLELAIVIAAHNRCAFTRACLRSLQAQTVKTFVTIVVDDGSTDGTSDMIRTEAPEVVLIPGDGELWWARATNLGVERALALGARRVMTLNDDTVAPPDFVEQMLRWSAREPHALLGALGVDLATREPVSGGERIRWLTATFVPILGTIPESARHGLHEVTHFLGRGLLIPAEVFGEIGLFDAKTFPQTMSDHDFTFRAARAGHEIYCNYDARLGIYPAESAMVQFRRKKSLANYYQHLFGMRGAANLPRFLRFAMRNCPRRFLIPYLVLGTLRRVFGYLRDWLLDALRPAAAEAPQVIERDPPGPRPAEDGERRERGRPTQVSVEE